MKNNNLINNNNSNNNKDKSNKEEDNNTIINNNKNININNPVLMQQITIRSINLLVIIKEINRNNITTNCLIATTTITTI